MTGAQHSKEPGIINRREGSNCFLQDREIIFLIMMLTKETQGITTQEISWVCIFSNPRDRVPWIHDLTEKNFYLFYPIKIMLQKPCVAPRSGFFVQKAHINSWESKSCFQYSSENHKHFHWNVSPIANNTNARTVHC